MDQERENYAERRVPTNWRRIRGIAGVLLALVLGVIVVEWVTLPHRYTQEEADRIRPGMTAEEVEAVFGRPPDKTAGGGSLDIWDSRAAGIFVVYKDGRVERTVFTSSDPPSFWRRWKWHLGLAH